MTFPTPVLTSCPDAFDAALEQFAQELVNAEADFRQLMDGVATPSSIILAPIPSQHFDFSTLDMDRDQSNRPLTHQTVFDPVTERFNHQLSPPGGSTRPADITISRSANQITSITVGIGSPGGSVVDPTQYHFISGSDHVITFDPAFTAQNGFIDVSFIPLALAYSAKPDSNFLLSVGDVPIYPLIHYQFDPNNTNLDPATILQAIADSDPAKTHPTVTFTIYGTTLALLAKEGGLAGNDIQVLIGKSLARFLGVLGTTTPSTDTVLAYMGGGKDGGLRFDITNANSTLNSFYGETDKLVAGSNVQSKDVSHALGVTHPSDSSREIERVLTDKGFPCIDDKPVVRGKNGNNWAGIPLLIRLTGFNQAREFLRDRPSGSNIIIATRPAEVSTPIQTSCGTIFQTELREVIVGVNVGPLAAPNATKFYTIYHTEAKPSRADLIYFQRLGFRASELPTLASETPEVSLPNPRLVGQYLSYQTIAIRSPNLLEESLEMWAIDQIEQVLDSGIEDWDWNATPEQMRQALDKFIDNNIISNETQQQVVKAFGAVSNTALWPFSQIRDFIRTGICDLVRELGEATGIGAKITKIVEGIVDKIEMAQRIVNRVNNAVSALLFNILAFKDFVLGMLDGFPGSIIKCLLGPINFSLPGIQAMLAGINILIQNFVSMILGVFNKLLLALGVINVPLCLSDKLINGLLGFDFPGLRCLFPNGFNIPIPECLQRILKDLQAQLNTIKKIVGMFGNVLQNLVLSFQQLSLFSISGGSGGIETCDSRIVTALLASVAASVGASAAAVTAATAAVAAGSSTIAGQGG